MNAPRWSDWERQVTPRSLRLLIIATLLGIGTAANVRPPDGVIAEQDTITATASTAFDRARADSIKRLIAIPAVDPMIAGLHRRSPGSPRTDPAHLVLPS